MIKTLMHSSRSNNLDQGLADCGSQFKSAGATWFCKRKFIKTCSGLIVPDTVYDCFYCYCLAFYRESLPIPGLDDPEETFHLGS